MTRLQKAAEMLENIDIDTKIQHDTLYVVIGDTELELSDYEIDYQGKLFDEQED